MSVATETPRTRQVPPLENGDHLSREEFYLRWESMPRVQFAERIEGIVFMPAATRTEAHGFPHSRLATLLGMYAGETPGVESGESLTIQADDDNDPQPDVCLLILPNHGGQCRITQDDYIEGVPELVAEISASSASRDLHQKLRMYERVGVREYLVWKTLEEEFVWHRSIDGQLLPQRPDADGIHRSTVFPGLWLEASALLQGRMSDAFAALRRGLETPEHSAFAASLAARRGG